jgi:ActR/RegA family two-component response regulator
LLSGEPWRLPSDVPEAEIARTIADCGGNVSEAARVLGLNRQSLHAWLVRGDS